MMNFWLSILLIFLGAVFLLWVGVAFGIAAVAFVGAVLFALFIAVLIMSAGNVGSVG